MDKIDELLTRGVEQIIPTRDELEKVLRSGKKLRVYQGFDPTSPDLHIGHLVGLRKLRQWQDLGHEVIFLIGDFTGMVGDPTGKDKTRVVLSREQVLENAKTYKQQAGKVLRFEGENAVQIKFNSEWLAKLSAKELAELTSYLTYQQVIEREMFQKRLAKDMDIAISEFLYPFMQGYDSVAMDVDVEVGGNDQLFNMMTGRDLMHKMKRKNKFVMTVPLLTDSQGTKIGKSEGNVIGLLTPPHEQFSLIMALDDSVIAKSFDWITTVPTEKVQEVKNRLQRGENPMVLKKELAFQIVSELHSKEAAKKAQEEFNQLYQQNNWNEPNMSLPSVQYKVGADISGVIIESGLINSLSEVKRLIRQGAIDVNGKTTTTDSEVKPGDVIRIGKYKGLRVEQKL